MICWGEDFTGRDEQWALVEKSGRHTDNVERMVRYHYAQQLKR